MRLILVLSIILLVSFVSISIINYHGARSALHEELIESSLPLTRENLYSELIRVLMPPINAAHLMGHDSFLVNWALAGEEDPNAVVQYLDEIRRQYGYFSSFFISEETNNYYYYEGILKQISTEDDHDVWYYNFVESGEDYVLDVDTNQAADDRLTIFINVRLEDFEDNLLGVTGVGIEMEGFSSILREKQEEYDRVIYLVDRMGLVQAHPDLDVVANRSIFTAPGIDDIALDLLLEKDEPITSSYVREGDTILVTSRYIPELDWFLIVEQNETDALASARESLFRTILAGIITSIIIIVISAFTVNHFQSKLELQSRTDELTGAANRREFDKQFNRSVERYNRYGTRFSVVLLDIDKFKDVNDTKGHIVGDRVLKEVTEIIQKRIRSIDLLARWGGDEFIILAECGKEDAAETAERIRQAAEKIDVDVSISCGVAAFNSDDTLESITARADRAMYESKQSGRNRVIMA